MHFYKTVWLTFCLVVAYTASYAQQGTNKEEIKSSLLWEIKGPNNTLPSYLLGTMHMVCKGSIPLDGLLTNKLKATQQVLMEIDLDDPNMLETIQDGLYMRGDTLLSSLLDEKQYLQTKQYFADSIGLDLTHLDKVKPSILSTILIPKLVTCELQSLDTDISTLAGQLKLETHGLETPTDQLELFDRISYKQQAKTFYESISDLDKSRTEFKELTNIYFRQDVDEIYQYIQKDPKNQKTNTYLLDDRNQKWIPVMEQAIQNKPTFFAVGIGHLGGPVGVIHLLREKGYTITPIPFSLN